MALRPLLGFMVAAGLLIFLLSLSTAEAHGPPERTDPEKNAVLDQPPASVEIWYPADLDRSRPAELRVVHNPTGRRVDRGGEDPIDPADPKHMRASLEPDLAPGRYVVSLEAAGAPDGHPVSYSYSFSVAEPGGSDNDQVTLMLAVFGAAAFAVTVGGAGYLLRRLLGVLGGPPAQPPPEHH